MYLELVPDARNIGRPVGVDTTDKEAQITRRSLKVVYDGILLYYKLAACTKLSHTADPWDCRGIMTLAISPFLVTT